MSDHGAGDPTVGSDLEGRTRAWLRCRACGVPVADPDDAVAIDGQTSHTFANPAGALFEVVTFAAARNLRGVGAPSGEFTWFPGTRWQIVVCAGCAAHLGWRYDGRERTFYGLVRPRLAEG